MACLDVGVWLGGNMGVGGLGQSADSSEVDQSFLVLEGMWDHLLETLRERAVAGDLGFPKGKCPRPQGCPGRTSLGRSVFSELSAGRRLLLCPQPCRLLLCPGWAEVPSTQQAVLEGPRSPGAVLGEWAGLQDSAAQSLRSSRPLPRRGRCRCAALPAREVGESELMAQDADTGPACPCSQATSG